MHPDEAVAIGAALYAHSLEDDTNLQLQLLDVIPMAIGLEKAGGAFHVVFPRNAAIPNAKQILATTSFDDQTELAMRIYQGDNDGGAATSCSASSPSPASAPDRAGEVQVEITFDVNVEGILTMQRARPGHRAGDEDHRPGDAELIGRKHGLGGSREPVRRAGLAAGLLAWALLCLWCARGTPPHTCAAASP